MNIEVLISDAGHLGISLSDRQKEQFSLYGDLLLEWNQKFNLTRITEETAVCRQHFLDSIMTVLYFTFAEKTLIDIGTGAGFPGIPLKIMNPTMRLTLLDALDKRCRFLQEVADRIGLCEEGEVTILHGRAEDYASSNKRDAVSYRETFDYVTSRAVARLNILCEYAVPFLKPGGCFIAHKLSGDAAEEADAVRACGLLGARLKGQETYLLPELAPERALYSIVKTEPTDAKYPRRAGVPEKKPL